MTHSIQGGQCQIMASQPVNMHGRVADQGVTQGPMCGAVKSMQLSAVNWWNFGGHSPNQTVACLARCLPSIVGHMFCDEAAI